MNERAVAKPETRADLFEIMYTCRAMRRLKPDPIPEGVLLQLVDAGMQAPSSSNAQNWRFVFVRDRAQKERIAALWQQGWAFYKETVGAAPMRAGEDAGTRARLLRAGDYMVNHIPEIPAILFVAIRKDAEVAKVLAAPSTLTAAVRHFGLMGAIRLLSGAGSATATGIHSTAYPAVQNVLLAARSLGLGAVLTTPHLFHPGQYEKLLTLPSDVVLTAVIPLGYPKGRFGPVSRPDPRSVVSWDVWRS